MSCRTKLGKPKKRYETRAQAKAARQRYLDEHGEDSGHPYRCEACGYFHLGHYPESEHVRRFFRQQHRRVS